MLLLQALCMLSPFICVCVCVCVCVSVSVHRAQNLRKADNNELASASQYTVQEQLATVSFACLPSWQQQKNVSARSISVIEAQTVQRVCVCVCVCVCVHRCPSRHLWVSLPLRHSGDPGPLTRRCLQVCVHA